jgi:type I restriction enzyme M protein
MSDKAVFQLLDTLRETGLTSVDQLEFALLILCWLKHSNSATLPIELQAGTDVLKDPQLALETMLRLESVSPVFHAFGSIQRMMRNTPVSFRPVLEMAARLNAAGMLREFEASDALDLIRMKEGTWRGMFYLPEEVSALMVGLADLKDGQSAYIGWESGLPLAVSTSQLDVTTYLESPTPSPFPAILNLLVDRPFEVHQADPITAPTAIEEGKPRRFDVALGFPPFGQRYNATLAKTDWYHRFPEATTSGSVLSIRHLLSQGKRRVVVGVPNNVLFSTGTEARMRTDLVQRGVVKAVIAMPPGLLSETNMPFAILVLEPFGQYSHVKFINADSERHRIAIASSKTWSLLGDAEGIINAVDSEKADGMISVPLADILANDAQLQVSRYLLSDATRRIQAILGSSQVATLDSLVETFRPMPTVSEGNDVIEVHEIAAADLPQVGYITSPGRSVLVDRQIAGRGERQFLKPFDIVLLIKGSVKKLGIAPSNVPPPGPGGWIVGQSAIILRGFEKSPMDSRALAMQLRSSFGQELLQSIVSGATIPMIQLRELMKLSVLVPSVETSQKAIEALDNEAKFQEEIIQLKAKQDELAAQLWPF